MSAPTAIAGVSPRKEAVITSVWPSIAATGLGRFIGSINTCIPLRINGIMLSMILFALPLMPLALLLYILMKLFGTRYVMTNRSVQSWATLGSKLLKSVPLESISTVQVVERHGQAFYKAADVELFGADGGMLLRMEGIPYASVFAQNLKETQDAASLTAASLKTIQARSS